MKKKITQSDEYDFRVQDSLYNKLNHAVLLYDNSQSEIMRKGLRKFNNLNESKKVEILNNSEDSTKSGKQRLKIIIPDNLMNDLEKTSLRKVLWWYLNLHKFEMPKLDIPENAVEGVDFKIIKGD